MERKLIKLRTLQNGVYSNPKGNKIPSPNLVNFNLNSSIDNHSANSLVGSNIISNHNPKVYHLSKLSSPENIEKKSIRSQQGNRSVLRKCVTNMVRDKLPVKKDESDGKNSNKNSQTPKNKSNLVSSQISSKSPLAQLQVPTLPAQEFINKSKLKVDDEKLQRANNKIKSLLKNLVKSHILEKEIETENIHSARFKLEAKDGTLKLNENNVEEELLSRKQTRNNIHSHTNTNQMKINLKNREKEIENTNNNLNIEKGNNDDSVHVYLLSTKGKLDSEVYNNNQNSLKMTEKIYADKNSFSRGKGPKRATDSSKLLYNLKNKRNLTKFVKKQTESEQRSSEESVFELNSESNSSSVRRSKKAKLNENRDLLRFANVYDSFSDESIDLEEVEPPSYIFLPDSFYKQIWDVVIAVLILYSVLVSPYQLAFENNISQRKSWFLYIDIFTDLFFLVDVILNFFTAYIDEDDMLIVSPKRIAWNYISAFFLFDVISSVPFGLISYIIEETSATSSKYTNFQKIFRLARFYRLLKWTRIFRMLKLTKVSKNTHNKLLKKLGKFQSSIQRLVKFLIFFVILTYLTSCLWCFLGNMQISEGDSLNWINRTGLEEEESYVVFIAAIYFTWGTIFSVGYGDIHGFSTLERTYLLFFMMVGCLVFSFVISSLSNIFSQIDTKTDIFNRKELLFEEMRKEYKIPQNLYEKIRKSIKYDYSKWNEDRIKLLDSLPGSLRNHMYLKMYENQIKHLIFFQNQSYNLIVFVLPLLRPVNFSKDDVIVSCGEILEEMYLVIRGIISLQLGYKYNNYEIGQIRTSQHFGDILMYINDQSNYDFVVKTKICELFILSKFNFAQIKINFKNSINDILETSYQFYENIERRRLAAVEYYQKENNLVNFKNDYIQTIKSNLDQNDFYLKKNHLEKFFKRGEVGSKSDLNKTLEETLFHESNTFGTHLTKGVSNLLSQNSEGVGLNLKIESPIKGERDLDNKMNQLRNLGSKDYKNKNDKSNIDNSISFTSYNKKDFGEDQVITLKPLNTPEDVAVNNNVNINNSGNLQSVSPGNASNFIYIKNLNINYSGISPNNVNNNIKKNLETIISENIMLNNNQKGESDSEMQKSKKNSKRTDSSKNNKNSVINIKASLVDINNLNNDLLILESPVESPKVKEVLVLNSPEKSIKTLKTLQSIKSENTPVSPVNNLNRLHRLATQGHSDSMIISVKRGKTLEKKQSMNLSTSKKPKHRNSTNSQPFKSSPKKLKTMQVHSMNSMKVEDTSGNFKHFPITNYDQYKNSVSPSNRFDSSMFKRDSSNRRNTKSTGLKNSIIDSSKKNSLQLFRDQMSFMRSNGGAKKLSIIGLNRKEDKDFFLKQLNDKIENDGFLNQNKVILQDYIKDFLGEKEGETRMKDMITKLHKLEKSIKEYVHGKKAASSESNYSPNFSSPKRKRFTGVI